MKQVSPQTSFPKNEEQILEYWRSIDAFKKSLEIRKDSPHYMFYDGPPFATGTPHYGHLLAGTIKDIIPRYQTMKGKYVERRFGWDTHGLPIEMLTEKELDLNGRTDILEHGIAEFNEACRAGVFKYVEVWEQVTTRLGRWIDFEDDYKTLDVDFMDSVWWVFKQLWDKDRIYEGTRSMPYSWRLGTPLSNFEASSNYKDVQDLAITVKFQLKDSPNTSILAWTTTPWTMPGNMLLAIGADIKYVKIEVKDGEHFILAEALLSKQFKDESDYIIIKSFTAQELAGTQYIPPFDFYVSQRAAEFKVVIDHHVTTDSGTGVVHIAAHGEDDHRVIQENKVSMFDATDAEGNFTADAVPFKGMNIKAAEKSIISALKDLGKLFKQETIMHSYPFCERSDTPLMYKPIPAWYVKVEDIREKMVANNEKIHWVPEHIKAGRFGKWLENARDWNISRNRFWGNPMPIWRCESCEHTECIGSRAELEEKSGQKVEDLHKHFVDELHWECSECSAQMNRIPEVLDCWFESGSMPYAQLHYPFENKDRFEANFPADFIAEGLDQTRGWFYTLMVLSTSLFESAPFKNVIVNGMILAEDGKKMSKRLKNYPDPMEVINSHGSDALRLFLVNSPVVKGESLRFSEKGVKDIVRSVMLPLWNVYSFFTTYASVDEFKPSEDLTSPTNVLDQWIISRFQTLLSQIEVEMKAYRLYTVVPVLLEFIEELTNWYVRRSRRRFWSDDTQDKQDGYNTLYYILTGFSKALAPFLPFITETIFQNLRLLDPKAAQSVHLEDYPVADVALQNEALEAQMELIQNVVALGRSLRSSLNIKTRQPLESITVVTRNESDAATLETHKTHIFEELNVKQVLFSSNEDELVDLEVKPNYPALGPIVGKQMKQVAAALQQLDAVTACQLEDGKNIEVLGFSLSAEHVDVRRSAKGKQQIETGNCVTVFYDTQISEQLKAEGLSREFVNRVQKMRKDADFHVSDRIKVRFSTTDDLALSLTKNESYIKDETLTVELDRDTDKPEEGELCQAHEIDSHKITISVARV